MATNIPPKLKSADISRFALRAAQVENAKPVIAYWCFYWIVSQILSKKLHTGDAEAMTYTTSLMDKLEQIKTQNSGNDAITDDMAGQAYVEQFGLETFQRAENAVRANKASRQTADTFQAAATFLDLSHIWGEPEVEITTKTKYAKFHALRIAKAVKAGEDPNLSNPKREPSPTPEETLDPNDLEVQLIAGTPPPVLDRVRTVSVKDKPDEHYGRQSSMAAQSNIDQSLHPSRAPSLPRPTDMHNTNFSPTPPDLSTGENYYSQRQHRDAGDVSPMEASPEGKDSEGGGYFPNPPTFATEDRRPPTGMLFAKPSMILRSPAANHQAAPNLPSPSQQQPPYSAFSPLTHQPPSPFDTRHVTLFPQTAPIAPPPMRQSSSYTEHPQHPPPLPPQSHYYPPQQPSAPQQPLQVPPYQHVPIEQDRLINDEEAITKAQKHARWAISALNFEDVKTAVKELRGALESLGAG